MCRTSLALPNAVKPRVLPPSPTNPQRNCKEPATVPKRTPFGQLKKQPGQVYTWGMRGVKSLGTELVRESLPLVITRMFDC